MKTTSTLSRQPGKKSKRIFTVLAVLSLIMFFNITVMAQNPNQMVRLAKITVDPMQLKAYHAALQEQMTTAVGVEKGVLTYYAMADKNNPAHITILEIYADTAAYQLHINTPHFKKYKDTVKDMVQSLELVDVKLLGVARKPD